MKYLKKFWEILKAAFATPPQVTVSTGKSIYDRLYQMAEKEIGQHEIIDGENPRIVEYHKATLLSANNDETPWCASFMNWLLLEFYEEYCTRKMFDWVKRGAVPVMVARKLALGQPSIAEDLFAVDDKCVPTFEAWARSFLKWGYPLKTPVKGCVVVLSRPPSSSSGHVALFVAEKDGLVWLLGGNQNNSVGLKAYDKSRILGYRGFYNEDI